MAAAFKITADPERFAEAEEWFGKRTPATAESAQALSDYARQRAWKIAGVAQLDIVQDVHSSLRRALEKGTPFQEWQSEVQDTLTRAWGKRNSPRIETIFRNATQQALNAGRWRQMHEPSVKRFRPYGLFDGIRDSRQSPICRACHGTIRLLDDPWWDTHSPQLHHKCRSSVRNLRTSEAERRGITPDPPATDAAEGFGAPPTLADWQADPSKYPHPLWNEYQRKAEQLRTQERPNWSDRDTAKSIAEAIEGISDIRSDASERAGERVRSEMRRAIDGVIPGAQSKDFSQAGVAINDSLLDRLGANGVHQWDGEIEIASHIRDSAAEFFRELGRKKPFPFPSQSSAVKTLIHEELHGYSRVTAGAYRSTSVQKLEEVGTELNARHVLERVSPLRKVDVSGSYDDYIDDLVGVVRAETTASRAEAIELLRRAHADSMLRPGPKLQDPKAYVDEWVGALDLTDEERKAIRGKFAD